MSDFPAANERDMLDGWMACQVVCHVWKACDGLDEIWVMTACLESSSNYVCEVHTAPAYLLVGFDDNSVA